MKVKTIIIFPYGGFEQKNDIEQMFWKIINTCEEISEKPLVVINRDTERRGLVPDFRNHKTLELIHVWSVDTCQMWLGGWGHLIDQYKPEELETSDDRVVLIPGDLAQMKDVDNFIRKIESFINSSYKDIFIGEYQTGEKYSAKELIDVYGTYQLLANWFPEISRAIKSLPLSKPRSEFLNIRASILNELLYKRKFAYEQTLNILITSWNFTKKAFDYNIIGFELGTLSDDPQFRQYRGCLDQIERSERLIKLLWREINEPKPEIGENIMSDSYIERYTRFCNDYDTLHRISTDILAATRITIRALLGT
ncbi:MAG: hypothetical protein ACMUIA_10940 [bacterium]